MKRAYYDAPIAAFAARRSAVDPRPAGAAGTVSHWTRLSEMRGWSRSRFSNRHCGNTAIEGAYTSSTRSRDLGKRIDAVVLIDHVLFVLEFKVGEKEYTSQPWTRFTTMLWI